MELNRVLIVWSELPEKVASFVCIQLADEHAEQLRRFHGHYINGGWTPAPLALEMNEFFFDPYGCFRFGDCKTTNPLAGVATFDLVIACGFVA